MPLVVVDTGVLYAMADRDDAWHDRVNAYLQAQTDTLIVPVTVLPEACYLLNTYIGQGAERQLLRSLLRGEMQVENLTNSDLRRALTLLEQYADANIGFVDATIVAIAERRKIHRLLTIDRRHFSLIRPRHCPYFELLP
ncbi:MAG: ribonuclease VapC26 [Candidatus Tectimicrobiota bacterium]|nr:MAG: ribonuclease VapC26 [Candidatus Tectomicrobia bacterium]